MKGKIIVIGTIIMLVSIGIVSGCITQKNYSNFTGYVYSVVPNSGSGVTVWFKDGSSVLLNPSEGYNQQYVFNHCINLLNHNVTIVCYLNTDNTIPFTYSFISIVDLD